MRQQQLYLLNCVCKNTKFITKIKRLLYPLRSRGFSRLFAGASQVSVGNASNF